MKGRSWFEKLELALAVLLLTGGMALAQVGWGVVQPGHEVLPSATALPTLTSCSTGALAAGSTDSGGSVTATGSTTCNIVFGTAWARAPFCMVVNITLPSRAYTVAVSATQITLASLTAADVVAYRCVTSQGGQ